ncbi:MAG: TonB family protein [Croceibacterium sp.]
MYAWHPPRAISASTSLAIVALIGAVLVFGLGVHPPLLVSQPLVSVTFTSPRPPPPPMPKPPPPHRKAHKAKDQPSPQNLRNKATAIVAPPVPHPLIPPPPVVVATRAGVGAAANTGASNERGPGQGAGGFGNGLGGGGDGGDGDAEAVVGPRQIRGALRYEDLPKGVLAFGQEAAVHVQYTVNPDGRVSNCRATRSSGFAAIDALTCRLLVQRFVFRPARDAYGRPVRAEVEETHAWTENDR